MRDISRKRMVFRIKGSAFYMGMDAHLRCFACCASISYLRDFMTLMVVP